MWQFLFKLFKKRNLLIWWLPNLVLAHLNAFYFFWRCTLEKTNSTWRSFFKGYIPFWSFFLCNHFKFVWYFLQRAESRSPSPPQRSPSFSSHGVTSSIHPGVISILQGDRPLQSGSLCYYNSCSENLNILLLSLLRWWKGHRCCISRFTFLNSNKNRRYLGSWSA